MSMHAQKQLWQKDEENSKTKLENCGAKQPEAAKQHRHDTSQKRINEKRLQTSKLKKDLRKHGDRNKKIILRDDKLLKICNKNDKGINITKKRKGALKIPKRYTQHDRTKRSMSNRTENMNKLAQGKLEKVVKIERVLSEQTTAAQQSETGEC